VEFVSTSDRVEILEILYRADAAASARDVEGYLVLFSDDAVLDGEQGRHVGKAALRAALGVVWTAEAPHSLHLTLNPVIVPDQADTDRVLAESVLLIVSPSPSPEILVTANITQELRRAGSEWRISRRTVSSPDEARPSSTDGDEVSPDHRQGAR
jgi:ketosteroid isomerase-like protein